jgi:Acyl-[acyl carrier protein]--UDP-N-acetylglucosamine O-acyltransferase
MDLSSQKNLDFDKSFFIEPGTFIHPTAIVGKNVFLGENVKIGPYSLLTGNITIDSGTRIHGFSTIGMPAQDINTKLPLGKVEIGKNCEIREFVTISSPKVDANTTSIGDNCYVMNFSHVAHDVVLEHNVTLINSVNLGGHVHVGHHTMLMANSAIHQFCKVGPYCALAPFSGMRQDLPPFCMFDGAPGKFAGLNVVALKRAKISTEDLNNIKHVTKLFFQDKLPIEAIESQLGELHNNVYVQEFMNFVKNSPRGITRKTRGDI